MKVSILETGYIFWVLAIFASISVGLGKGGVPVIANLAVPILSLVMSPIAAAGLLLPVYIVSDIFALSAYRRAYDKRVLKIGILGMTVGVILGWATAKVVLEWTVTLLVGLMGISFAFRLLIEEISGVPKRESLRPFKGFFWSIVTGFTSFISHSGGPPWQIYTLPLGLSKSVFVGTSVIAFSYVNWIKLFPYYFLGQINISSFLITLYLIFPASLAVYLGVYIVKLIDEKVFFKIVTWALMLISFKLVVDGVKRGFMV